VYDDLRVCANAPVLEPVYRNVLIAGFSTFGLLFGTWYVGLL
jgi:hypothetical protein